MIANVYYAALREATRPVLRRLCDQILPMSLNTCDFRPNASPSSAEEERTGLRCRETPLHEGFLAGTCLVVWRRHRRAFRAGR